MEFFATSLQVYGKGWYNVWKDKWGETHADQARTEIEAIIAMYDPNAAPPSPPPPTPPPSHLATSPPELPRCMHRQRLYLVSAVGGLQL